MTRQRIALIPPPRFARFAMLGHDPGDDAGALAAVDVDRLTNRPSVRWVLSYSGQSSRLWTPEGITATTAGCLFGLLSIAPNFQGVMVCEQLKPFKGYNRGFQTLVEAAGAVKHWARAGGISVLATEPNPSTWRAEVLNIRTGTPADACAAAAVAAVEGRPVPGSRYELDLGLVCPVKPIDEHGAEAICIALHGLGYRVTP